MTTQEIYDLLVRFERSSIHSMKLRDGDFSLELAKAEPVFAAMPAAVAPAAAAPTAPAEAAKAQENANVITAPLAGVFYAASAPGETPFVAVGDRVEKGQTVCLMEAMKMISEIPAPCDCIITEILGENGVLAAFGDTLFRFQPC